MRDYKYRSFRAAQFMYCPSYQGRNYSGRHQSCLRPALSLPCYLVEIWGKSIILGKQCSNFFREIIFTKFSWNWFHENFLKLISRKNCTIFLFLVPLWIHPLIENNELTYSVSFTISSTLTMLQKTSLKRKKRMKVAF